MEPVSYLQLWKNSAGYYNYGDYYKKGTQLELVDNYFVSTETLNNGAKKYFWFNSQSEKENKWEQFTPVVGNLNSQATAKGRNENTTITDLYKLSIDDLGRLLAYGQAVTKSYGGETKAAHNESGGAYGLLDFKYVGFDILGIPKNNVVEINSVVYNANEFGKLYLGCNL